MVLVILDFLMVTKNIVEDQIMNIWAKWFF